MECPPLLWMDRTRRSPAQKAQASKNLRKISNHRQDKENHPPQISPSAHSLPAACVTLTPVVTPTTSECVHHKTRAALVNTKLKLATEHQRSKDLKRELKNMRRREDRLQAASVKLEEGMEESKQVSNAAKAFLRKVKSLLYDP